MHAELHTFFHIDMGGRLKPGMSINLSRRTPSLFGANYWRKFRCVGIESVPCLQNVPSESNLLDDPAYRELWLEIFRTDHPEIRKIETVSRLNSFFVVESLEDAHRYVSRSKFLGSASIFEVHSMHPGKKHDMTWLDQDFPRDFRQFGYYYLRYWQGLRIEDDPDLAGHEKRGSLTEVLLASPVTIGSKVSEVTTTAAAV
jgi:hypothetical protein